MLSKIRPQIKPISDVIARPFYGVNPNLLTIVGVIPPFLFLFLLVFGQYWLSLFALLGVAFDFLDGAVARATNRVTKFGGLLDSTLDRLADAVIITAFGFSGLVGWGLVTWFLVASFLTSYIRSRAELASEARFKLDIGILERPERLLGIALSVFLIILFPDIVYVGFNIVELLFVLLAILSSVTVIQRLHASSKLL